MNACAVHGCGLVPVDDAALCSLHLRQLDPGLRAALQMAWRVYILSDRISDSRDYQRRLLEALLALDLATATPLGAPVQLRLVK